MFSILISSFQFAWKKAISYKANLISWFLADLGMYLSTILLYVLLGTSIFNFSGYSNSQMLLYISNSFIINNIFSIFFSESIDYMAFDVWNGKMYYSLLKPRQVAFYYFLRNINLKSLFITPVLIAFNIYCFGMNGIRIDFLKILIIVLSAYSMGIMFLFTVCLDFIGLKSEAINPIMVELLDLRDKPDKMLKKSVRNIFVYLLPIYLTSAIPTKIMIGSFTLIEVIYFFTFPFIGTIIFCFCLKQSMKYYTFGTEEI